MTPLEAEDAVDRINAVLETMVLPPYASIQARRGTTLFVCHATLDEWNAVADSEIAMIGAHRMAWLGPPTDLTASSIGEIHLVEDPRSRTHAVFPCFIHQVLWSNEAIPQYLSVHGAQTSTHSLVHHVPDGSYGPKGSLMRSLSVTLPANVPTCDDFVTLKFEVRVVQDWGEAFGQLDWKALQWFSVPGVVYVLCIRVDNNLETADYKLYDVRDMRRREATAIVAPRTTVRLDARRVRGLGQDAAVSMGFPDPLEIDLFACLPRPVRACDGNIIFLVSDNPRTQV